MEKLLKLLNEYFDKDGIFKAIGHNDRLEIFDLEVKDDFVRDETVISKQFGFIEWLVQNDKMDRDKVDDKLCERQFYGYTNYEIVLMLLSISDTPIEDLISYLK